MIGGELWQQCRGILLLLLLLLLLMMMMMMLLQLLHDRYHKSF
jgi:hypothetical protein